MNYVTGHYWVYLYKGDQSPTIARLGNSGWVLLADRHSHKMIKNANKPYKVLYRILEPMMENDNGYWY